MPKINKGYVSLFEYLAIKNFPLVTLLVKKSYPHESISLRYKEKISWRSFYELPYSHHFKHQPYRARQLVGGFQAIADMIKDFSDTFKPYKSSYYAQRDFSQPFRGLLNVAKGIANLVAAPLIFLGNTIKYAFKSNSFVDFASSMKRHFSFTTSWLLDGVLNLVRGVTQIASTPLTWFIKIPLRGLLTATKGKPKVEQNNGIQKLVSEARETINILEKKREDFRLSSENEKKSIFEEEQDRVEAIQTAREIKNITADINKEIEPVIKEGKSICNLNCIIEILHSKYEKSYIRRGQDTDIPSNEEHDLFSKYLSRRPSAENENSVISAAKYASKYIGLFSPSHKEKQKNLKSGMQASRPAECRR